MNIRLFLLITTFVIAATSLQAMFKEQEYQRQIDEVHLLSSDPIYMMCLIKRNITLFGQEIAAEILKRGLAQVHKSIEDVKCINDMTVLHCAVCHGYLEVVELLLSLPNAQALATTPGFLGRTPLHCAAHHGRVEIARIFLKLPYVQAFVATRDIDGRTALHVASFCGQKDIVALLLALPHACYLAAIRDKDGRRAFYFASTAEIRKILGTY